MRRWTTGEPPEAENESNAYGSAVHDAIAVVERSQCSDEAALDQIWIRWGRWLDPEDMRMLTDDLALYRERTQTGWRLLAAEKEMRVPLARLNGRQIYFRFRLDSLYQSLSNPAFFLHRDYKSSKWQRSQTEVDDDVQLWAYNWAIHEMYPECGHLVQEYDQLRFGVLRTGKSAGEREQVRKWLVRQVKAVLADDTLEPKMNQWCPWCPIKMDCRVTHEAGDYWRARLNALGDLDTDQIETYVDLLPEAQMARKLLESFEEELKAMLRQLPQGARRQLGYDVRERRGRRFDADALRDVHAMVGDEFYQVASITKTALEQFYGKLDGTPGENIWKRGEERVAATYVQRVRSS